MKQIVSLISILFVFFALSGLANATLINESVFATISGLGGDNGGSHLDSALIGTTQHLFDVTYDDEGTIAHEYYDSNGSVYRTEVSSAQYAFYDDATFLLSPWMLGQLSQFGGYDFYTKNLSWVYHYNPTPNTLYAITKDDFRLQSNTNPGNSVVDIFGYNDSQSRLWSKIYFTNLDVRTAEPVPEPTTMILFGAGIVGIVSLRIRKKRK